MKSWLVFWNHPALKYIFYPADDTTSLDSVYTHDPCVISNGGIILCTMGKDARVPESKAMEAYFESIDVPILGRIQSPGTLEGGDVVWINDRIVAVGEGYRSNAEGIRQFKNLLGNHVDEVIACSTSPLDRPCRLSASHEQYFPH